MGRTGTVLLLALGMAWTGCRATKFVAPDEPDLYKVPYDFAAEGNLDGADFAGVDLAHAEHHDLSLSLDLHVSDDDLSVPDDLASDTHD